MKPILSDSFTAVLKHLFRTHLNICGTEKEPKVLTFAILTKKVLAANRAARRTTCAKTLCDWTV